MTMALMLSKKKLETLQQFVAKQISDLGIEKELAGQIKLETGADYRFRFSNQTSQLELIRQLSREVASYLPFSEEELDDIGLAIDEACTNVIKHSYNRTPSAPIYVGYKLESHRLVITIEDHGECGQAFNPEGLSSEDKTRLIAPITQGGVGVYLITKLMDEIEYTVRPGVSNHLYMVKYLRNPNE